MHLKSVKRGEKTTDNFAANGIDRTWAPWPDVYAIHINKKIATDNYFGLDSLNFKGMGFLGASKTLMASFVRPEVVILFP